VGMVGTGGTGGMVGTGGMRWVCGGYAVGKVGTVGR
jgi:hypothetical protein